MKSNGRGRKLSWIDRLFNAIDGDGPRWMQRFFNWLDR